VPAAIPCPVTVQRSGPLPSARCGSRDRRDPWSTRPRTWASGFPSAAPAPLEAHRVIARRRDFVPTCDGARAPSGSRRYSRRTTPTLTIAPTPYRILSRPLLTSSVDSSMSAFSRFDAASDVGADLRLLAPGATSSVRCASVDLVPHPLPSDRALLAPVRVLDLPGLDLDRRLATGKVAARSTSPSARPLRRLELAIRSRPRARSQAGA